MELEKIKLSYPVLSIETIIHYFSERKSTAIEWLLLEIIKKVENNSLFSNMTIAKILKDIFFIDNSNQLVRPCLTTLVDMKAVQIDGYYDGDSLDNIFCSQIHLTQVGSRMQEDGLLPAIENEVQKKFYFASLSFITLSSIFSVKTSTGFFPSSDAVFKIGAYSFL